MQIVSQLLLQKKWYVCTFYALLEQFLFLSFEQLDSSIQASGVRKAQVDFVGVFFSLRSFSNSCVCQFQKEMKKTYIRGNY